MIAQPTQVQLSAYSQQGKDAALVATAGLQLALISVRAFNRSGGASDVGICRKFANESLKLFQYTAVGDVYTEVDLPLAAASTIFTATNNDGFVVQSKNKSGLIGMTVSDAGAGGTFSYQYWDGNSWETLTTIAVPADYNSTGDKVIVFLPPNDWAAGGSDGLDSDMYSIRVRGTTAPGSTVDITSLWSAQLLEYIESVADNNGISIEFENQHPLILQAGEGLMPYFGTANAANGVRIAYTTI